MFPTTTLIISLLIVIGMIVYQIDAMRLGHNPQEIEKRFPEFRFIKKVKRMFENIMYTVGIRIFKTIHRIRKKIRKTRKK